MLCCISHKKGSENVNVLSYGDGKIRVYLNDRIDERLSGVKQVRNQTDVVSHLRRNETPILVPIHIAKTLFGWVDSDFAEPETCLVG